MINKFFIGLLFALPVLVSCNKPKKSSELVLPSPDSKIQFYFNLNVGEPYYLVYFNNNIVVDWSSLGLTLDNGVSFTEGLVIIGSETRSVYSEEKITLTDGTLLTEKYNELIVYLKKESISDVMIGMIFRVYNGAVSMSYFFKENRENENINILSEETQFDLYNKNTDWIILEKYNFEKQNDITDAKSSDTLNLPATFISKEGIEVSFFETVKTGYPEMKLVRRSSENMEYKCFLNKKQGEAFFQWEPGEVTSSRILTLNKSKL
jgi:hypothetical protein